MLPKHIDRPTRISYFRSQVVLTRFFSKQGVKFNFLRQNKYAKSRPIINYKRHNVVNTHTSSLQIMLQSPQKNNTRSLPTSFRTLVRRYLRKMSLIILQNFLDKTLKSDILVRENTYPRHLHKDLSVVINWTLQGNAYFC